MPGMEVAHIFFNDILKGFHRMTMELKDWRFSLYKNQSNHMQASDTATTLIHIEIYINKENG
jgi:hypothetical protein